MAERKEELVAQFIDMTSASPQDVHACSQTIALGHILTRQLQAQQYLANSSWDLSSAVTEFYNPPEEGEQASQSTSASRPEVPQPIPTTSSAGPPPAPIVKPKKFATLGDLSGSSTGGHAGHNHDDDEDDEEDDDPNLYAGGEKSGLAVENPDDLKRKIIERAKRLAYPFEMHRATTNACCSNAQRPGGDDPRAPSSHFTGTAHTLGGDDTPSEMIPDPVASTPQRPQLVTRRLHFWADGFSVDDGPLYRLDDPRNSDILAQIKQGRAPMHILNVRQDQEVDVQLEQHRDNYVPPKKKYKPFEGGGQRLGSPTPGVDVSSSSISAPAAAPSMTGTESTSANPSVDVNESEPTVSLQIRLGDGTRLVSRFNTTHTIGDVYNFVNASSPIGRNRPWALMTTFPSKELTDKNQILGDLAEFKRGGVVVQKWR